jgi:hypothetical protein
MNAIVCLGEIPLRLKMRKAHSTDVTELETLELLGRGLTSALRANASIGAASIWLTSSVWDC